MTADASTEFAPAEKLTAACAVIVEPANPNETLFEFENMKFDALIEFAPADILMSVSDDAMDAVIETPPAYPHETPFEFANAKLVLSRLFAPAEITIGA